MKRCVFCNSALNDWASFCTNCGNKQPEVPKNRPAGKTCPKCGTLIPAGYTYCPNCFISLPKENAPAAAAPQQYFIPAPQQYPQQYSQQGNAVPYYAPQQSASTAVPNKKSKKTPVILSLTAFVLVLAILLSFVWPGWLRSTEAIEGGSSSAVIEKPAKMEKQDTVAVPQDGFAETSLGVSVDFSDSLDLGENPKLTVEKAQSVEDRALGATYTAYEISVGELHELDGFVEIRLPYSGENIEKGEDPAACVAGMYFNEETQEWESTLYEVDTAKKELVIHTDHFSTYGCFEFKNEGKRRATVTAFRDYMLDETIPESAYVDALREIVKNEGEPGEACRKIMLPYLKQSFQAFAELNAKSAETTAYFTNIATLFVNGVPGVDKAIGKSELAYGLNSALGKAGLVISVASLATTYFKDNKTDQEIISMYKDAMYVLAGVAGEVTGEAIVGTVGSAVWVVDVAITDMGSYVYNRTKDNLNQAYRYYMTKENRWHGKPRTLAGWRKELKKIAKEAALNHENPEDAIMDEIDRYCGEFWTLPDDTLAEIYDDAGVSERGLPDAATKQAITDEFKGEILDYMKSVLPRVQDDLEQELWEEQQKRLDNVRKILNQQVKIEIAEDVPSGKKAQYAGYTVSFAELNEIALEEDWSSTLSSDGDWITSVTYIGYLLAGSPEEVRLWAPGKDPKKDPPDKTAKFALKAPVTKIPLGGGPDWLGGVWGAYERASGSAIRITILNDTTLQWDFVMIGHIDDGSPLNEVRESYVRNYSYDEKTDTVLIEKTMTGKTDANGEPGYVLPMKIIHFTDENGQMTITITRNPAELTGSAEHESKYDAYLRDVKS